MTVGLRTTPAGNSTCLESENAPKCKTTTVPGLPGRLLGILNLIAVALPVVWRVWLTTRLTEQNLMAQMKTPVPRLHWRSHLKHVLEDSLVVGIAMLTKSAPDMFVGGLICEHLHHWQNHLCVM